MPREGSDIDHGTIERLLLEKYEPIAIVGVGLRFPGGSNSLDEFDEFLKTGSSGIRPIPDDRWDVAAFTPESPDDKGKIQTSGGGFLDRIDLFDAPFFNISPKEAQYIDPQQRMILETAWQALEHANIDPTPLRRGNGGVYIGASSIDYALELDSLPYEELDGHLASGITMFPLSGRLSYFLGWRGPSMSVDTACSSSLTALHMAVKGLRSRECDIALCGGVNALHHPRIPVMFSHAQMLAPDGQCKTFDESADGYVRAEGCGILVVKRLSDAIDDGDNVIAVIRGTAVGQDGDSAGLTVPNGAAQEIVIRNALKAARLEPGDIQYVEAHGTGTPLGDPIELGAINDVFVDSHTKDNPLVVGSVKTNLGHMEPASGVVGVIKAVLQIRSGAIYPHLNFSTPSGRIPWDLYPVTIPTEYREWKAPIRRAVVNSFGFAGTISAVVLEQPPAEANRPQDGATAATALPAPELPDGLPSIDAESEPEPEIARIFTLSAKGSVALRNQIERFQRFLELNPEADIDQLCYTRNIGRAHFSHRIAGPVASREALDRLLAGELAKDEMSGPIGIRKVAFMFSGQGSQYAGMGAALYRRFTVFRDTVDECDRLFGQHLDRSIRAMVLGEGADPEEINQTRYTQPALFTLEYGLARLWMSWGVKPNVLIGHSIGEVVAATVAGLFDLPDAVTLVAARARLMQSVTAPGGMAAVSAPAETVEPLLAGHPDLALAAINAPDQCVISGGVAALATVTEQLRGDGVRVDALAVSHAFHSPLMTEVFDDFRAAIADISFHEPSITLVSNLTGKPARLRELGTADYWVRHIGEPVRFAAGIQAVAKRGRHALIEIGPSSALTALARRSLNVEDHLWLNSLSRRDRAGDTTLRALATFYAAGLAVSWAGFYNGASLPKVALPTYSFQHKRYWLPAAGPQRTRVLRDPAQHPLLGREVPAAHDESAVVREFAADCEPESFADHRDTDGVVTLPTAAYIELLLALQDAVYGHTRGVIEDLRLAEPLVLPEETTVTVRTRLRQDTGADRASVEVLSGTGDTEVSHATAVLSTGPAATSDSAAGELTALAQPEQAAEEVADRVDVYTDFASVGRVFGERYQLLDQVSRYPGGVVTAELTGRDATAVEHVPVEVLECALSSAVALDRESPVFTPCGVQAIRVFKKPRDARLRVVARVATPDAATASNTADRVADLLVLEGDQPVIELRGVALARPDGPRGRRYFLHRQRWLRQSAVARPVPQPRHVLVAGGDPGRLFGLADQAAAAGDQLSFVADATELAAALREQSVTDVCWFWQAAEVAMSAQRLREECERNYRQLLDTVSAVEGGGPGHTPRLWLVTEQAQWVADDPAGTGEQLPASTLWGFGHVLLNEYPQYRATLVDLPADATRDGGLAVLFDEFHAEESGDFQIAYRAGRRYVRRLLPGEATPPWRGGFEVRAAESGELADLAPAPAPDQAPVGDQIQVLIHSVALTHADLALAQARPDDDPAGTDQTEAAPKPPVLGGTGSGTVVAVGETAGFAIGDQVLLQHPGTLRRTVTVEGSQAARTPYPLGLAEAAGLAAAFADTVSDAGQPTSLQALVELAERGELTAASPEVYCLDEVGEALRTLAAGADDGAVAVSLAPERGDPAWDRPGRSRTSAPSAAAPDAPVRIRPDRTYVVTGGLGGLGLVTARKLVDLGARQVALLSRRGQPTAEAAPILDALSERAEIILLRADIGNAQDVARVTEELLARPHPVGGIVHAAGEIGKSLIAALTWEDVNEQLNAKVYGGWLLHEASASFPELEFFSVFSSIASVVGGATQAHYAAASAFLDALADWRGRQGLPGLSTNWGAWARVGMSARLEDHLSQEIERSGIHFFSPARALRTLHGLFAKPVVQRVVSEFDWDRFVDNAPVADALYSRLARRQEAGASGMDLVELLAKPKPERLAAISAVVRSKVAAALHVDDENEVEPTAEFVSLGLDSLMAMTVKSGLESEFRIPLPASLAFDYPSVQQLTEFLDGQLAPDQAAASQGAA